MLLIASVQGRVFAAELVAQVLDLDPSVVTQCLSGPLSQRHHLVRAHSVEWLTPAEGTPLDSGQRLSYYRFRHAVFQKYLYKSWDVVQRPLAHQAVAETLEMYYRPGNTSSEPSAAQLAWHFAAAGLVDEAVDYLLLAGYRAMELSAHEEAIALFTRGLNLLTTRPPSSKRYELELKLQIALGAPLLATEGWGAAERGEALERAYELGQRMGGRDQLIQAMFSLADLSRAKGSYRTSLRLGEQMLDLAGQSSDLQHLALAHGTLGETEFFLGHLHSAHQQFQQALASYDAQKHRDLTLVTGPNLGVICLVWDAWTEWMLGRPEEALKRGQKAAAVARDIDHPFSLAFAIGLGGIGLRFLRREYTVGRAQVQELGRLVETYDMPAMEVWATLLEGWAATFNEGVERGLAQMRGAMTTWREMGAVTGASFQTLMLAEACQRAGRFEEALDALDSGLELIEGIGEACFAAEMKRLRGHVLLQLGASSAGTRGDGCYQTLETALSVAREQGAKMWELRAAISLAYFWKEGERLEKAVQALRAAYDKLNAGLDTPDLREARGLLDDLCQ
jgi:tetratricopeptide (TPR) repeat protein